MNQILSTAIKHWSYIAPVISRPTNDKEFKALVLRLDELLGIVGNNENHSLMGLVDLVSDAIASYEEQHQQEPQTKGIDALKAFMLSHHLHQNDLSEIASQGVMSEILNEKRPLNLRQIKLLAKRFHVSPATFIDEED